MISSGAEKMYFKSRGLVDINILIAKKVML